MRLMTRLLCRMGSLRISSSFRAFFLEIFVCQRKHGTTEVVKGGAIEAADEEGEDNDIPLHHLRCKFALPSDSQLQEATLVSNNIVSYAGKWFIFVLTTSNQEDIKEVLSHLTTEALKALTNPPAT